MQTESPASRADAAAFESEVHRVCSLLYPGDVYGGPTNVDGQERDGIYVTDDLVVIVEATTSATKAKAEKDGKKLKQLADSLSRKYPYKGIKAYFITRQEPTADQMDVVRKIGLPVTAISFSRLRSNLIDSKAYLSARMDAQFGSARDPETDAVEVIDRYVSLDYMDVKDRKKQYDLAMLIEIMQSNGTCVLVGDFGTGKSMTLREVFLRLRKDHLQGKSSKFCIHLNLNQHQGQTDPYEALIRHASIIGFEHPAQLVKAWRSGEAHVVLDGFDELFLTGFATGSRPIAEIRKRTVELAKRFIVDKPIGSAVLVAGREHYFDSIDELARALSLSDSTTIVSASDFTEDQVKTYLKNRQWTLELPDWLPRRPLLVGYFASRELYSLVEGYSQSPPGLGWNHLIEQICLRESRTEVGMDAQSVRMLIERLATYARLSASGLGPLQFQDLVNVYRDLFGYLPDEGAYSVLQRLPGLQTVGGEANSRNFVDDDFVDAARAGDVLRWIESPYDRSLLDQFLGAQNLLGEVGLAVLAARVDEFGFVDGKLLTALNAIDSDVAKDPLRCDVLRLILSLDIAVDTTMNISEIEIPQISFANIDYSSIAFSGCIIRNLELNEVEQAEFLPSFANCSIESVSGVAGLDEFGTGKFVGTDVAKFVDSTENMTSILQLTISDERRVALTILRKVFLQSGHSRKESALYRGSLSAKQRELIPKILARLESDGAIRKYRRKDNTLWVSNISMSRRVKKILETPASTDDPLVSGM